MDDLIFKQLMIQDEGEKLKPYLDTKGKWTIGIGHNLTDNGIKKVVSDFIFSSDLADMKAELNFRIPWWMGLSEKRQLVIASMAFNMGVPALLGFRKMIQACIEKDFSLAAVELLDSDAARESPARYHRLADMMEKG